MGAVLGKPISSQLLQRKGNKNFKVGSAEMQGYRMTMEDTHCVAPSLSEKWPEVGLFGVFDGHAGERASKFLEGDLHPRIAALEDPTDIDALRKATIAMDTEFCSRVDEREDGSTCCYVVVYPGKDEHKDGWEVIAVNVGDSRAMIVKEDGTVVPLTDDHKPENPEEAKRIHAAGGEVRVNRVDGQLAMSRAIGDWQYKQDPDIPQLLQKVIPDPGIQTGFCRKTDTLVVVCDGIVEQQTNDQAMTCVYSEVYKSGVAYADVDNAVLAMNCIKQSLVSGSKDNHSAMIITFVDGTSYSRDKDEFIAGPFHPYQNDKNFVKAYLADAEKHGYSGDELMELAKKAEVGMAAAPVMEAQEGGAGAGSPAGLAALQAFLSQPGEINERLSLISSLFSQGGAGGEGEDDSA